MEISRRKHDAASQPHARNRGPGPSPPTAGARATPALPKPRRRRLRRRTVVWLLLLFAVMAGIFFLIVWTDFIFGDGPRAGGSLKEDHAGVIPVDGGDSPEKLQAFREQAWPGIKGALHLFTREDIEQRHQTPDGKSLRAGEYMIDGAGLVLHAQKEQVRRMGDAIAFDGRTVASEATRIAVAEKEGTLPAVNRFGYEGCEPRNDDDAEDDMRFRMVCAAGSCPTRAIEDDKANKGILDMPAEEEEGTPYIPSDIAAEYADMEARHRELRQQQQQQEREHLDGTAHDGIGAGGDEDLEAMLNIFRLYGQLFNLSLAEKKVVEPVFETAEEVAHRETMAWYVRRFLSSKETSSGVAAGAAAPRQAVGASSSTVSPLAILEQHFTASDDPKRYTPKDTRHPITGERVPTAHTASARGTSPLEPEALRENIFALNAETEKDLVDDGYAAQKRNHVPRSDFFNDPFHLARRGYGTEASIFVAVVPVFSQRNGANYFQQKVRAEQHMDEQLRPQEKAKASGGGAPVFGGGDSNGRHVRLDSFSTFTSPAHRTTVDGEMPVEAALNSVLRDPDILNTTDNALFEGVLNGEERDSLMLDGLENRQTACAGTLESLYKQARWPLAIFTGVLEVGIRREYALDDEPRLLALDAELERRREAELATETNLRGAGPNTGVRLQEPTPRPSERIAGGDGAGGTTTVILAQSRRVADRKWRAVRVNGTTPEPRVRTPGGRGPVPLRTDQRSSYHILFSCVPNGLQRRADEESFGFRYKDNIRTRRMLLPQNEHKQRGTAATPEYFAYNDGNIFPSLPALFEATRSTSAGAGGPDGRRRHHQYPTLPTGELPFSSEYAIRLSLLRLYRGETYVMFVRVEEFVGGIFAGPLLGRSMPGPGDAFPSHLNANLKQRYGAPDASRAPTEKLTFYETFATRKVFRSHWDWVLRLQYLALPDKERAILSTRPRAVTLLLDKHHRHEETSPRESDQPSQEPQRTPATRPGEEARWTTSEFPFLYAAAVEQVLRAHATSAEVAEAMGQESLASPSANMFGSFENPSHRNRKESSAKPFDFVAANLVRYMGGSVASNAVNQALMVRRQVDRLHLPWSDFALEHETREAAAEAAVPPQDEKEDGGDGASAGGGPALGPAGGADARGRRRGYRQLAQAQRDAVLQLYLPAFAYNVTRTSGRQAPVHTPPGEGTMGAHTAGQATQGGKATMRDWTFEEKMTYLLFHRKPTRISAAAPGSPEDDLPPVGGNGNPAAGQAAQTATQNKIRVEGPEGLTSREVAEILFSVSPTEDFSDSLRARYCDTWLAPELGEGGGGGGSPFMGHVYLLRKKSAEFCFALLHRRELLSAMAASFFTSPSAPEARREVGATVSADLNDPRGHSLRPRFVPSITAPATTTRAATPGAVLSLADEVPVPSAQTSFSSRPNRAPGTSPRGSVLQRMWDTFFPLGRSLSPTELLEQTIPPFRMHTRLVRRAGDALQDMTYFAVFDGEEKDEKVGAGRWDAPAPSDASQNPILVDPWTDRASLWLNAVDAGQAPTAPAGPSTGTDAEAASRPQRPPHFLSSVVSGELLFARAEAFFNMSRELQSIFDVQELLATTAAGVDDDDGDDGEEGDGHDAMMSAERFAHAEAHGSDRPRGEGLANMRNTDLGPALTASGSPSTPSGKPNAKYRDAIDAVGRSHGKENSLAAIQRLLPILLAEKSAAAAASRNSSADEASPRENRPRTGPEETFLRHCQHKQPLRRLANGQGFVSRDSLLAALTYATVRGGSDAANSLAQFLQQAPEAVHLDPFLFLLTRDENDLLLSSLLWTSGWNLFAPTENILFTMEAAAPAASATSGEGTATLSAPAVDTVSEERFTLLRKATVRRLRKMLQLPYSPHPVVYIPGAWENATVSAATAKKVLRDFRFAETEGEDVYFMGCTRSLKEYWAFSDLSSRFDLAA